MRFCQDVLVVDDGSTDGTRQLLAARSDVSVVTHERNRGYGAALNSAFQYSIDHRYDVLVTIDCDGQHEPQRIPRFVSACRGRSEGEKPVDIVSGSRYLKRYVGDSEPPEQRRLINEQIAAELNRRLGLHLTDAFCGFKAYRVEALKRLAITEFGYAMPLQLWVQAVARGMSIVELPVPLIYLEEARSFGGMLDDARTRLRYYCEVLERSIAQEAIVRPPSASSLCRGSVG